MQRCIEIATYGFGNVAPNPMVGAVITYNNEIIGEGYHQKYGEAHAEVNAINSLKDKHLLSKSTLYVNLEPCSHYGKTPPCADLIIKHKIPKVVIGSTDTFTKVHGRGIEKLKLAGIDVTCGILEKESRELNRRFFTYHETKKPYVILKWAQTLDGFIDAVRIKNTPLQPLWITNKTARTLVHRWRSEEQSIMVGTNTAAKDNPKLNVRDWAGKNPLRVLLDKNLRLDRNLNLFDNSVKTIVFTEKNIASDANTNFVRVNFDETLLITILEYLYHQNIQSIIIEGGAQLLNSFIKQNLWDEARVFIGDISFGSGVKAPDFSGKYSEKSDFGDSRLYIYRNKY